jgi:hypothetical protein
VGGLEVGEEGEFLDEFGGGEFLEVAEVGEFGEEGIALFLEDGVGVAEGGDEAAVDHGEEGLAVVVGEVVVEVGAVLAGGMKEGEEAVAVGGVFHVGDACADDAKLLGEDEIVEVGAEVFAEGEEDGVLVEEGAAEFGGLAEEEGAGAEAEEGGGEGVAFDGPGGGKVAVIKGLEEIGEGAEVVGFAPLGEVVAGEEAVFIGGDDVEDEGEAHEEEGPHEEDGGRVHGGTPGGAVPNG